MVQLGLFLLACTNWHQVDMAPDRVIVDRRPGAVRLTRLDSSRVVLLRPQLIRDSLVGDLEGTEVRVGVPRDSVHSVAVRRVNSTLTALVLVGLAGVVVGALCLGVEGVCFPGS